MAKKSKLEKTMENAEYAFWEAVADAYPEVKSGDLPPCASFRFREACREAINLWLNYNSDEEG